VQRLRQLFRYRASAVSQGCAGRGGWQDRGRRRELLRRRSVRGPRKPLSEHDRDLADEDVAEDAATDARDRAEDGLVLDYDGAAAWYRPVVRMRHR
jgi:hypothetical protein